MLEQVVVDNVQEGRVLVVRNHPRAFELAHTAQGRLLAVGGLVFTQELVQRFEIRHGGTFSLGGRPGQLLFFRTLAFGQLNLIQPHSPF